MSFEHAVTDLVDNSIHATEASRGYAVLVRFIYDDNATPLVSSMREEQ